MGPDDSFGGESARVVFEEHWQLTNPDVSMELPAVDTKSSKPITKVAKGKKGDEAEDEEETGSSSDVSRKLASVSSTCLLSWGPS